MSFNQWLREWLGIVELRAAIAALDAQVLKMADILDQIQAEEGTVMADLGVLQTAFQGILSTLQDLKAGNISTGDARFQATLAQAESIDASIQAMIAQAGTANPPSPGPVTPPAPEPTPEPTPAPVSDSSSKP